MSELDALRWTGRKGYGARALVGACLVKSLYAIPTWTRVASLISEHASLQSALGGAPSHWACYRFATKLREQKPLLDACLARVISSLRERFPEYGNDVALDASDLPAYANGQRFVGNSRPSWSPSGAIAYELPGFHDSLSYLDTTPLPCGQSVQTTNHSELAPWCGFGYSAAHSRFYWGMRLVLWCGPDGCVRDFDLGPPMQGSARRCSSCSNANRRSGNS